MQPDVDDVLRLRHHRILPPEHAEHVAGLERAVAEPDHVGNEHRDHHHRAEVVDQRRRLEAADEAGERCRPGLVGKEQRHARQRTADESEHQQRVHQPFDRRKAPVVALRRDRRDGIRLLAGDFDRRGHQRFSPCARPAASLTRSDR
ncbi:MAG: hypothetical protein IPO82_11245 [Betaproteobacteria bacterium]|nr:hypothetical protein [Betaproteobacteria bacterium]